MEKILKIISFKDNDYDKIIEEAGDENLDHSSGWYLHGMLEDLCHYDLATIYNMSDFPEDIKITLRYKTMINDKTDVEKLDYFGKSYLHGIQPVEVYGVQEECVGYFWISDERECIASILSGNSGDHRKFMNWYQRGLVCLKSDKEAIEYAKQKYAENSSHL